MRNERRKKEAWHSSKSKRTRVLNIFTIMIFKKKKKKIRQKYKAEQSRAYAIRYSLTITIAKIILMYQTAKDIERDKERFAKESEESVINVHYFLPFYSFYFNLHFLFFNSFLSFLWCFLFAFFVFFILYQNKIKVKIQRTKFVIGSKNFEKKNQSRKNELYFFLLSFF